MYIIHKMVVSVLLVRLLSINYYITIIITKIRDIRDTLLLKNYIIYKRSKDAVLSNRIQIHLKTKNRCTL